MTDQLTILEARFAAANEACIATLDTPAYPAACVAYRAALDALLAAKATAC